MKHKVHKGAIGGVAHAVPAGMGFLFEEPKVRSKSKWCSHCKHGKHHSCSKRRGKGKRQSIDRKMHPCECPCQVHLLDPDL